MSLYHLHGDIIGRSQGKSAVGSVAYQFRVNATDLTTGDKLYYSRKNDKPLSLGFCCPDNCAEEFRCTTTRQVVAFWNKVQQKENRVNSQFCRDFDIALQSELTLKQNIECLEKWIDENYTNRGLCSSYAIHQGHVDENEESNNNIHAHVMIALRKVDQNGWTTKDREGNDKKFLNQIRKSWADIVNDKFQKLGIDAHIDERTLKQQGIDRIAQKHAGPTATAMQRKGKQTRKQRYVVLPPVEITDEEVNKKLSEQAQEELKQLQGLEFVLNNADKTVEQVKNNFAENGNENEVWNKVIKYGAISTFQYINENYQAEVDFYEQQQNPLAKNQLQTLATYDFNSAQHMNAKTLNQNDYNKLFGYDRICEQHFPEHHQEVENWFKKTTNAIASGARKIFHNIKSFMQEQHKFGFFQARKKNQEQTQKLNRESKGYSGYSR